VFLKQPDGKLVPVGTSGNAPPSDEEFVIEDVQPGATYVARVVYFLALTGQYQLTVTRIAVSTTVTTGSKEAYTLTCETQSGNVLETLSLVIDRDQLVSVRLGCGDFPSTDAAGNPLNTSTNCVLLATAPAIGCAPVPTGKPTVDLSGGPFKVKLIKARRRQDQGRIARRGFYAVRCKLTAKGRCIVRARMGQRKIGTGRVRMKKANNRVVRIRLSRRALQRVQRGGKLKLRAVGRSPGHKRPRARLKVRIPPA
jgi:hypothetical protein